MATDVLGKLLRMLRELHLRIATRRSRPPSKPHEAPAARRAPSESLRRLRRGEITLRAYLERKVDHAIAPLDALLHESDVLFTRAILLEKLDTDPVLSALVARIARIAPASRQR